MINIREVNVPPFHDYSQVYPMFDIVDVIFDFQVKILNNYDRAASL